MIKLLERLLKAADELNERHPDDQPLSYDEFIKLSPEHKEWAESFRDVRQYLKTFKDTIVG